jgi:hypothetical protein
MGIEEGRVEGNIPQRVEDLISYRSPQIAQVLVVIPILAKTEKLVVELLEAVRKRGSAAFQGCGTELDVADARYLPSIRHMR